MSKRRVRPVFFVCAGCNLENELHTKSIQALSIEEATEIFNTEFGFKPKDVLGPFHKKKTQVLVSLTKLVFSNVWKQAEYKGWKVNACILKQPENHAMLLFKDRLDGQILPKPQGTTVVPIYDLRLLNAK